jgi:hypothetical protein
MTVFGLLVRKAQATVDNAIGQLVNGIIVAVPLLVAAGFATASLSGWLHRHYEPELCNLILAGGFGGIGLLAALVVNATGTKSATPPEQPKADAKAQAEAVPNESAATRSQDIDHELLIASLTSAAPIAVPMVFRSLLRNLPLVLVILVAAFILTRPGVSDTESSAEDATTAPQPVE